ncbi:MAG: hypothetical protein R6U88_06195 [Candidatus Bipolaricaulota bacterium]
MLDALQQLTNPHTAQGAAFYEPICLTVIWAAGRSQLALQRQGNKPLNVEGVRLPAATTNGALKTEG